MQVFRLLVHRDVAGFVLDGRDCFFNPSKLLNPITRLT